ncbi:hypothetical protein HK103_006434 [Boothiomyces macroporosus]|uniref:DUF4097 domain-containing protein n=1 Tax=Boothiomyces macroporosus TaxID=261099 RepID=A0AAD5UL22_9FUNG|nr:hypothetical protein HK103_006434 [Boothiomyces macroporosus]
MEIHYKGSGLHIESQVSFEETQEPRIGYVVKSNDPNCLQHLLFDHEISADKLEISITSDYNGFHYPTIHVDLTITMPKASTLSQFQSEGGLVWKGQGIKSPVKHFSSKSNFGSLKISDLDTANLELSASAGSISLSDITSQSNIDLKSSFGSVSLENVATDSLSCKVDSGGIRTDNVTINEKAQLETSFGSIKGTEMKSNSLIASASSGTVHALKVELTDAVEISSSFGSVQVDLCYPDYGIASTKLEANSGSINGKISNYKKLDAHSNFGSIKLDLSPRKDENSSTKLFADSGSIKTTVYEYQGQFDATTSSGSLTISGDVEFIVDKSHQKSGIVREGTIGTLYSHSTFGSTTLNFK